MFRGANRYFPPPCFVSLPFDELTVAPRLLRLQEKNVILRNRSKVTQRLKRYGRRIGGSDGGAIAKIGGEGSGGMVLHSVWAGSGGQGGPWSVVVIISCVQVGVP